MNLYLLIGGLILLIVILSVIGFIIRYRKDWFKRNKKKLVAVVAASTVLAGSGLLINPPEDIITATVAQSVWYHSSSTNSYYRTNTTQSFDLIRLNNSFVIFNTTVFKASSTARVDVTIMELIGDITGDHRGETSLAFYLNGSAKANITIGGFKALSTQLVFRNDTLTNKTIANSSGYIWFNNTIWNRRYFSIVNLTNFTGTIRTNGIDYFVWLGDNCSAYWIKKNITGINAPTEYIAQLNHSGSWDYFYGDNSGNNYTVHTYDVIKTYENDGAGSTSFNMVSNPDINYTAYRTTRAVSLKKIANGYNYTGYTNGTTGTLSIIDTKLASANNYFIALWNRTTFTWNYYIRGWSANVNKYVLLHNVILTKIDTDKTWNI